MDIPLRTDAPRMADTEPRNSTDNRNSADACGFGDLFAEVRQRDNETDMDRDTPPPGTEAAFAAQTAPVQPRQSTPAAEPAEADATDPAQATGAIDGPREGAAESAAPAALTAASNSPENFAALLESTASALPSGMAAADDALANAGLNAANAQMPSTPAAQTPPPVNATVATPLHSPAWPAAFNNTIRVLVSDQTQVARLQLTPGDLGPVDVRIAISDHRAEIAFAVSSPEAKAAIQQALPQLRETFAASGLELGDASFGESPRGSAGEPSSRGAGPSEGLRGTADATALLPPARAVGLIDLYA